MNAGPEDTEKARTLSLPEELILMLLNENNGYFFTVPGWNLNCAVVGSVLAELSLRSRIDSDMESLFLVDCEETGNPLLDPILAEIAAERNRRDAKYWVERLSPQAESIVDLALNRLVDLKVIEHHDGDFWTLSRNTWQLFSMQDAEVPFVKTRIGKAIFENQIPHPRDVIIISLVNTCDVFRFMFQLDDEAEQRIEFICNMDLIGRSLARAVTANRVSPLLRHSGLAKQIPVASLTRVVRSRHIRTGNIPALFAELTQEYGPVFELRPPFSQPLTFLAGPEVNRWANRNGRMYLRAKDYFTDLERVYGASGVLPSLDGGDHFRLRKAMSATYSRARLAEQLDDLYAYVRGFIADWKVGDIFPLTGTCRKLANSQISPLFVSIDSQDLIEDLVSYKERALNTKIVRALPQFMLNTSGMKRKAQSVETLVRRIRNVHTPAHRARSKRDLVDDVISLHTSEPQFVPESNLRFLYSAALLASMYFGDALSFALFALASKPDLAAEIRCEADELFQEGDPKGDDFSPSAIDVTRRFLMECLRTFPIVPMSMRNVMNSCVVEGYELPVGARVHIAQTATHFMEEVFPDPFRFDIDRYTPYRKEHLHPGYAPYGLGTHKCLASQWTNLHLAVNVLMVARYFSLELYPVNARLRISPLPSLKPSKRVRLRIAERRLDLDL